MKELLAICFILVSTNCFTQTKQETIDWINSKFKSSFPLETKIDGISSSATYVTPQVKIDGSVVVTMKEYWGRNWAIKDKPDKITICTFNLNKISLNNIVLSKEGEFVRILVNCSSTGCIIQKNASGETYSLNSILFGYIDLRNEPNTY